MNFLCLVLSILFLVSGFSYADKKSCGEVLKIAKAECTLWDDRVDIYSYDEECIFDVMNNHGYSSDDLVRVYEDEMPGPDYNDYTCFSDQSF